MNRAMLAASTLAVLAVLSASACGDSATTSDGGSDGSGNDVTVAEASTDAQGDTGGPDAADAAATCHQTSADAGNAPVLLASGQSRPTGIAVDGTSVYWANSGVAATDGTIVKCPLAGCGNNPPTSIATGRASPYSLVVDGTSVYWVNLFSTLEKCPLSGCSGAPVAYASGATKATGVAIDATNIYWTEVQTGVVASCPLAGCASPNILYIDPAKGPTYGVLVDATTIYWLNNWTSKAYKAPLTGVPDGGAPTLLATNGGAMAYAAMDGTTLYWSDYADPGRVMSAPLTGLPDGGAPTVLAGNLPHPKAVIVDRACDTIYWATTGGTLADGGSNGTGAIHRCPSAGCAGAPEVVVGTQNPVYVTQDADTIYWTNFYDGTVWKRHK